MILWYYLKHLCLLFIAVAEVKKGTVAVVLKAMELEISVHAPDSGGGNLNKFGVKKMLVKPRDMMQAGSHFALLRKT